MSRCHLLLRRTSQQREFGDMHSCEAIRFPIRQPARGANGSGIGAAPCEAIRFPIGQPGTLESVAALAPCFPGAQDARAAQRCLLSRQRDIAVPQSLALPEC